MLFQRKKQKEAELHNSQTNAGDIDAHADDDDSTTEEQSAYFEPIKEKSENEQSVQFQRKIQNAVDKLYNPHMYTDGGMAGERAVYLELCEEFKDEQIFCQVKIQKEDSEKGSKDVLFPDFVVVSPKGIFIVEVKNWYGSVTGNVDDDKWKSVKESGSVGEIFDNPIKQLEVYAEALYNEIEELSKVYDSTKAANKIIRNISRPFYLFAVFCDAGKLHESLAGHVEIRYYNENRRSNLIAVTNICSLIEGISGILKRSPDVFNEDEILRISEYLSSEANSAYTKKLKNQSYGRCTKCGSPLVIRSRDNEIFLGCLRYKPGEKNCGTVRFPK